MIKTNILIAGCGDLGTRVGIRLQQSGHHVVGARRSVISAAPFTFVRADLSNAGSLDALPNSVDLVIVTTTPDIRDEAHYQHAYVRPLQHLLSRYQQRMPYFIFVSSTAVYGQSDGEWVDEASDTSPKRFNGQVLLEAEKLLHDVPSTVVRFSGIYGRSHDYIANKLSTGISCHPTRSAWTNRIHIDDCVGVLTFLSEKILSNQPLPQVFLASDALPLRQFELYSRYASALALPAPTLTETLPKEQGKRCSISQLNALGYQLIFPELTIEK